MSLYTRFSISLHLKRFPSTHWQVYPFSKLLNPGYASERCQIWILIISSNNKDFRKGFQHSVFHRIFKLLFLAIDTLVTYDLKICSPFMENFPAAQWIEYCTTKAVPVMETRSEELADFLFRFVFSSIFSRWFVPFPILYCDQDYKWFGVSLPTCLFASLY